MHSFSYNQLSLDFCLKMFEEYQMEELQMEEQDQSIDIHQIVKEIRINTKDIHENTLMHHACVIGNRKLVEWLINQGLEINSQNCQGWTPLHFSCFKGYFDIVVLLLQRGANPNIKDYAQNTPLFYAWNQDNKRICEIIIKKDSKKQNKNMKQRIVYQIKRLKSKL